MNKRNSTIRTIASLASAVALLVLGIDRSVEGR